MHVRATAYYGVHKTATLIPVLSTSLILYFWYIDDIFGIWIGDVVAWQAFKADINDFGILTCNISEPSTSVDILGICNPYDIKFNNGYYLLISYIICVNSRLLIGLVFTAIVFLDSKISNINNFQYQHSIFLLNTRRRNKHSNGYHLLVADAVKVFDIVY